jgi:uncharacterized protein
MKYGLSLGIILGLFFGYLVASTLNPPVIEYYYPSTTATLTAPDTIKPDSEISVASLKMPAVDNDGNGVVTMLDVQVLEGSGRALANIDKLLFWTDTQTSIRTARSVAEEITKKDLSQYDLVYTIRANASVIEGPSAGAALTIATIAALQNKKINQSVMITGTINLDGTIGPVGEVFAKAKAAKQIGAQLFLVPESQSTEVTYSSQKKCDRIGWSEICTIEQVPEKVDISKEAHIEIREVKNVQEALKYFLTD